MEETTPKTAPIKRAPGAGVKAADGVQDGKRYNVMLDPDSVALFMHIGKGALSLGAREAARRLAEAGDVRQFSEKRHALRTAKPAPKKRSSKA
ncbi:hypothetical protein [Comamonas thiooxydans]|uniref:hypothetical protein n=1 Tax=Comamonas thiooxydans TaxID=363952 RepID=UPI000B420682|nr:hypothetical protein [Comamonas thiooxydans]